MDPDRPAERVEVRAPGFTQQVCLAVAGYRRQIGKPLVEAREDRRLQRRPGDGSAGGGQQAGGPRCQRRQVRLPRVDVEAEADDGAGDLGASDRRFGEDTADLASTNLAAAE